MTTTRLHFFICFVIFSAESSFAQDGRIQQARETRRLGGDAGTSRAQRITAENSAFGDSESFGVQQLLRENSAFDAFSAFAELSASHTNNARFTRNNKVSDSFVVPSIGLGYRRKLPAGLQFDVSAGVSFFRYNTQSQLDFTSMDLLAMVGYRLNIAGGIDVGVGYRFNNLYDTSGDSFFHTHGIDFGAQKSFALGGPHSAFVGVGVEIGYSEPSISERSEYLAFAGYSLQATANWDWFLRYRYSYYDYSEGERGDDNHTISVGTRYRFSDYCSLFASYSLMINRSNQEVFNYESGTSGVGVTVNLSF